MEPMQCCVNPGKRAEIALDAIRYERETQASIVIKILVAVDQQLPDLRSQGLQGPCNQGLPRARHQGLVADSLRRIRVVDAQGLSISARALHATAHATGKDQTQDQRLGWALGHHPPI